MKKSLLALALVCGVFSGQVWAQGDYVPGYVYVDPNATYMYGTFNNRFNNAPTTVSTYIGAGGYAGGLLYFYGQDASGRYFYCYIPTTSPIYQSAVQIKNTLGNGSLLSVERTPPSSECTSVYSAKASHYLN